KATIKGVGISMDQSGAGAPVVVLESHDKVLPIFVDPNQAQSIERARQGIPVERPLTHDLFADVLDKVDVTIEQVRIDDLTDETYYAKLDLTVKRGGGRETVVQDTRPSDGIALAVRKNCPIKVNEDVLAAAGQPPERLDIKPFNSQQGTVGSTMFDIGHGGEQSREEQSQQEDYDLEGGVEIDLEESDEEEENDDDEE
ncbi:MAG: bifunctional nuclease family protein, partial [Halobacteriaceae archaeon]